jgi:hypothetical protein
MNAVADGGQGGTSSTHITVMAGGQVMTGGVLSCTEIVRLHVEALPQASVAVHVRVTEYSCGHEPGVVASELVMTGIPPQLSVAVALSKVGVAGHSIGDVTVGQVMTGAVWSFTVMVCEQVDSLSQPSVAT